ncbi:MAG: nitrate reductase molybdenum cofactor assembly chaperone [Desulfobacterales bacterium]|jgi:nitrate reductase delta subunit|nr:nitrate reductase molybdenum cofactor assembly chaperone [Desulfobacterales bacterium]
MKPQEKGKILKLLSVCLSYPDDALAAAAPEIEQAAAGLGDPNLRMQLSAFAAELATRPLLSLQEHYTAVFDMRPQASLNLTYHLLGDREERGRALAGLLALYQRSGFEPAVNELPDYLPLMLEFLSIAPEAATDSQMSRCLSAVPVLLEHIAESPSIYAVPLEILGRMLPDAGDAGPSGASDGLPAALEE